MLEVLLPALNVLKEEASPLGLEVNWQKTNIQSTIDSAALPPSVLVTGNSVDIVESFVYLGSEVHSAPAAQNLKSAVGSVWPKPASINLIEEYGAPASLSLPKFNYTEYTFNRSSSTALKHGP